MISVPCLTQLFTGKGQKVQLEGIQKHVWGSQTERLQPGGAEAVGICHGWQS